MIKRKEYGKRIPPIANTIKNSNLSGAHIQRIANVSANCSFSFKYLQMGDSTFLVNHADASYYHKVIERLQGLSSTSVSELMSNRSPTLRCHPIDWLDSGVSREKFGILREDELCDKPYQISIGLSTGRLHGFFTGDIFNIVWFDKDHKLYPGK